MLRNVVSGLLLLAVGLSMGCASVATSREFNGLDLAPGKANVSHINGQCSGLYFLSFPLITGDTSNPETWIPTFAKDNASLEEVSSMVSRQGKIDGASALTDLNSSRASVWVPVIPFPILFWRTIQMSGNSVR